MSRFCLTSPLAAFKAPRLETSGTGASDWPRRVRLLGITVAAIACGRNGQFVPAGICWAEQPKVPRALACGMAVEGWNDPLPG